MLKRYELLAEIGRGGMGVVWHAYDRLTGHPVALKYVEDRRTLPVTQHDLQITLAYEFRALASLIHPNIVRVFDYGFDADGNSFYTMTLLNDPHPVTADWQLPAANRIQLLIQILQALIYLHQHGILHRDLKPSNILVQNEQVMLVDFGLAVEMQRSFNTDGMAGTLAYMAPELLRGSSPSIQSDLYSFGLIAYELLTGQYPFDSSTQAVLLQEIFTHFARVHLPGLPAGIDAILERLLLKDPLDRYSSASDVLAELCEAADIPLPAETEAVRDSFLRAAQFVGRSQELTQFESALDALASGTGSAWLVAGESGVGKSRLMDEVRIRALTRGLLVLRAQAVMEQHFPFHIWRDMIRMLLLVVEVTDEELSILSSLVPDTFQITRRVPVISRHDARSLQERLPSLLLDLFRRALQLHPLVLIFEDVQWAEDSVEILRRLTGLTANHPLVMIANYRDDEAAHLQSQLEMMHFIKLKRLDTEDIHTLVASMLGQQSINQGIVLDFVERESEGNAFFIVEVVRALAESAGRITDIGKITLPPRILAGGIQRIIAQRIGQLSDEDSQPLYIAAVAGREIDFQILAYLFADLDIDQWLRSCSDAAILSVEAEKWHFSHDKIRDYILSSFSPEDRVRYHAQIAVSMEIVYADRLSDYAPLLAYHFGQAQIMDKEGMYSARAAQLILEYDPAQAETLAKRALDLVRTSEYQPLPESLAELYYTAGQAALRLSNYPDARQFLEAAFQIYEELNSVYGLAKVKIVQGEMGFLTAQYREAIPLIETSLPVMEQHGDWYQMGFGFMNLGILHARLGDMNRAKEYFVRCLDAMEKTGDPIVIAKALNNLAISYDLGGDMKRAIAMHERSLALRRSIKDRQGIAFSLTNIGAIQMDQGDIEQSEQSHSEAYRLFLEIGNRRGQANSLSALARIAQRHGNYEDAHLKFQEGLLIAQEIGDRFLEANIYSQVALMNVARKLYSEALSHYQQAIRIFHEIDTPSNLLDVLFHTAELYEEQGYIERALMIYLTLQAQETYQKQAVDKIATLKDSLKQEIPSDMANNALSLDDLVMHILTHGGEQ